MEISLEAEMSTDIVTATPSIDFSVHWSKVVRERIRYNADDVRSPIFFREYQCISSQMMQKLIFGINLCTIEHPGS